MSVIFRIYQNSDLTERELNESDSFTLGSGKKDTVCLENAGLGKKQISFTKTENGWQWKSAQPAYLHGKPVASGVLKSGEILLIDQAQRLAVTMIERTPDDTQIIDLSGQSRVSIGRSSECDIVVASHQISGKHLELCRSAEGWIAQDLGSSNGTYCNGKLIREKTLQPGDFLDIGPCRLILTGDHLSVDYKGAVKSNFSCGQVERTAEKPEDPYPCQFHRSPRLLEDVPSETIEFQDAPSIGGKPEVHWAGIIIQPLAMIGITAAVSFFMGGPLTMLYFSAPMTLVSLVMSVMNYRRQIKNYRNMEQLRLQKYDEYLDEQEERIRQLQGEQRRILMTTHPTTADCLAIAAEPARRLWERRRRDRDFMELRVGEGSLDSCVAFQIPHHGLSLVEDDQAGRAGELAKKYEKVSRCPITCPLGRFPTCGVIGDRSAALAVTRNMLVQAATHHSYEDLRMVLLCKDDELAQWSFVKWLPHIYDDTRSQRYIADSAESARRVLSSVMEIVSARSIGESRDRETLPDGPHFLFVCADKDLIERHPISQYLTANDPSLGVSAIFLYDELDHLPKECMTILEMQGHKGCIYQRENASVRIPFAVDPVREELYDSFARALAPIRIELTGGMGTLPSTLSFMQGYRMRRPEELNLAAKWEQARPEKSMAVPIGVQAGNEPFYFDIHEKKSGPHGLVAGMTGSGKSEMVQSWILSMALAFPPEAVSFVLIDFKGTGLILPFRNLPHLAGTISDLDTTITRNLIALANELTRRKALLDEAGVSNITGYLKLYREGKVTTPLSYLFLIIDEFAEFKVQFPDFMQVINRVFAIGRTLGVHIILLTQKPGSVVDDKMSANTRFRWCLKVASSADSNEMLHHTDAARITNPGRAYVQVGEDEIYTEIQSYWSGAPYNPNRELSHSRQEKLSVVDLYGFRKSYEPEKTTGFRAEKNEIDAIVEYLDAYTRKNEISRARNIWTSKLPGKIELPELLHIAFDGEHWGDNAGLAPVVGMLDNPRTQSQYPMHLDLLESGHTVIYGAPGSGKTTFLQTLILSAALSYSPQVVSMYLLDFGGGSLNLFRDLPHVGAVAHDHEEERVMKICRLISDELGERKDRFSQLGIVSMDAYREATGVQLPYLILIVDNFGPVLNLYPDLDEFFQILTREGSGYGIYLVATANSENAVSFRISQNITGGVALRMQDRSDYNSIVGRTDGLEPENLPGRGLCRGKPPLEFQTALPVPGESENQRVAQVRQLAELMDRKWDGPRPKKVPVLPKRVLAQDWTTEGLLAGLDRETVEPVSYDLEARQFLMISSHGSAQGWQLLQALTDQLLDRFSNDSLALYDPGSILSPYKTRCSEYMTAADRFDSYIADLMPVLQKRKEQAETPEGIQWLAEQPEIIIVIGDHKRCFDLASNETMRRLSSIISLGKGLKVCLVILSVSGEREELRGDMFTINLNNKADVLMVDGSFRSHGLFDSQLDYSQSGEDLPEGDAWLLMDGQARRIKAVEIGQ